MCQCVVVLSPADSVLCLALGQVQRGSVAFRPGVCRALRGSRSLCSDLVCNICPAAVCIRRPGRIGLLRRAVKGVSQ